MRLAYHVMSAPAPLGLLFLAAGPNGLRYVEFMDRRSLKRTIASHEAAEAGTTWEPSLRDLRPLADQLDEYLSGARRELDWPLDPQSDDELSLAVWRALRRVPYGATCTVASLAREVGQPRNLRAVAQAVLTNPLAIVVPCHRVLGADGKPSNYVGGLPRKKFLISVEQRFHRMGGLDDNRVIGELVRRAPRPAARVTPVRVAAKPAAAKKRVAVAARAASPLKAPKKRPR
jgi:O-6-methylguanine DNA methyltransferase